jgi:hypothetical protein
MIELFSSPSQRISTRNSARAFECLVTLERSGPMRTCWLSRPWQAIKFDRALKSRGTDVLVL